MSKEQKSTAVKKKVKSKQKRQVFTGIAHIKATFNNTIISITDLSGRVVSWSSGGKVNFSGSRKSSTIAATMASQNAGRDAMSLGMKEIEVRLKGPGVGRESAVRGLVSIGLTVVAIKDITSVPHNGCRARKRRRV